MTRQDTTPTASNSGWSGWFGNGRRLPSSALVLAGSLLVAGCATTRIPDIEAVDLESGSNTIRLEVVGRYRGGIFGLTEASTPRYDPVTKRLYVPRADLGRILVLDISDPARPERVLSIGTIRFGGLPKSIDIKNGILAVALQRPVKELPGAVIFLDVNGEPVGGPVTVGPQPSMLIFTPDGRQVIVANSGEANDDYSLDPEGSVSIVELGGAEGCRDRNPACALQPTVTGVDFRDFNQRRDELVAAGVRIYGPGASVAQDLEPESVAVSFDSQTAWVGLQRNNAIAILDLQGAEVADIRPLGTKDHSQPGNGIDASDQDGAINIRPWLLRSFYQPDMLAPYRVGDRVFLVTANEGDPRDFDEYTELVRVRDLTLDENAFPDAASLQEDRNLGRLRVTRIDGDSDGDGDFDEIFLLGSRSFGIWSTDWQLVFDSGDALERISAQAVPKAFNTPGAATIFDRTSDTRGPEPEALAVGEIESRTYAFVAPERIGGIYVYDITDPVAPEFQQYVNFRNFDIDPAQVCAEAEPQSEECAAAGDLEPEGVLFIPAADAPAGFPLVVLTHEVSNSITLYRVDTLR